MLAEALLCWWGRISRFLSRPINQSLLVIFQQQMSHTIFHNRIMDAELLLFMATQQTDENVDGAAAGFPVFRQRRHGKATSIVSCTEYESIKLTFPRRQTNQMD